MKKLFLTSALLIICFQMLLFAQTEVTIDSSDVNGKKF